MVLLPRACVPPRHSASLLVTSHPASCPAGNHLQIPLCPGMRVTIEQLRLSSRQHTPRHLTTQQPALLASLLYLAEQAHQKVLPADADSPGHDVEQPLQTDEPRGAHTGSMRQKRFQGPIMAKPLQHRQEQVPSTSGSLMQTEGKQMQQHLYQAQGQGQGQRQQHAPRGSPVATAGQGLHDDLGGNMLPRTEPAAGASGLAPGSATCAPASVKGASASMAPISQATALPSPSGCAEALTTVEQLAAGSIAQERQAVSAATAAGLAAADADGALAAQQTVQLSAVPEGLHSLPPASLTSLTVAGAADTQHRMPSSAVTDFGMDLEGSSSHLEEVPSTASR